MMSPSIGKGSCDFCIVRIEVHLQNREPLVVNGIGESHVPFRDVSNKVIDLMCSNRRSLLKNRALMMGLETTCEAI